jgi:Phage integrase family
MGLCGHKAYRKLFKHAGVNGHPHRLRHTFAKNLLLSGVPLETASLLLAHKKLAITEKHYARFVPERQKLIENQVRKSWSRIGHMEKSTTNNRINIGDIMVPGVGVEPT